MSGTLYVVATPIGNLEDITLRALRVLREVDVIAAEDTRRTAKLLTHYGITTPTVSFHEHNTRTRIPQIIGRLERGESVAIVSDAGTPGVSDPGVELVRACIDRGIHIDPLPGASALLAAVVASGFETAPTTFLGFPPARSNDRRRWWLGIGEQQGTLVFFEAPHRIRACLAEAAEYLGNRPLVVARELTKMHQEFLRGTAVEVGECLKAPRGEFTIVIGPTLERAAVAPQLPEGDALAEEFRQLTQSANLTRRAAISELARKYDRPSREVYARLETTKTRVS